MHTSSSPSSPAREVPNIVVSITTGDVHLHFAGPTTAEIAAALSPSLSKLENLIMATSQQYADAQARIDEATTAIAALIRKLVAQQQAGGMTAEEEDAALAKYSAVADALEAMGKDPNDPVPVPVPEPLPDTGAGGEPSATGSSVRTR